MDVAVDEDRRLMRAGRRCRVRSQYVFDIRRRVARVVIAVGVGLRCRDLGHHTSAESHVVGSADGKRRNESTENEERTFSKRKFNLLRTSAPTVALCNLKNLLARLLHHGGQHKFG